MNLTELNQHLTVENLWKTLCLPVENCEYSSVPPEVTVLLRSHHVGWRALIASAMRMVLIVEKVTGNVFIRTCYSIYKRATLPLSFFSTRIPLRSGGGRSTW
jgi:hypothetical protein